MTVKLLRTDPLFDLFSKRMGFASVRSLRLLGEGDITPIALNSLEFIQHNYRYHYFAERVPICVTVKSEQLLRCNTGRRF